jgi:hypothetical protein
VLSAGAATRSRELNRFQGYTLTRAHGHGAKELGTFMQDTPERNHKPAG